GAISPSPPGICDFQAGPFDLQLVANPRPRPRTPGPMGRANAVANGQPQRTLTPYEGLVRSLSDRLVEAQRPIRILDAIKWDDDIERAFFEKDGRELPPVTREYYQTRPLPFDPEQKLHEFHAIERDIRRQLGEYNAPGQI